MRFERQKLFAVFAAEAGDCTLMRGMTIVGPLFPSYVHFLGQKSMLSQVQSRLGGELSIVPPAVSDDFFVLGQDGEQSSLALR
jgi:hypothetical protein